VRFSENSGTYAPMSFAAGAVRALPMQLVDKPMEQVVDARLVDVSMCALQRENRGRSDCYRTVEVARLEAGVGIEPASTALQASGRFF
jgi:hypothetical protein